MGRNSSNNNAKRGSSLVQKKLPDAPSWKPGWPRFETHFAASFKFSNLYLFTEMRKWIHGYTQLSEHNVTARSSRSHHSAVVECFIEKLVSEWTRLHMWSVKRFEWIQHCIRTYKWASHPRKSLHCRHNKMICRTKRPVLRKLRPFPDRPFYFLKDVCISLVNLFRQYSWEVNVFVIILHSHYCAQYL